MIRRNPYIFSTDALYYHAYWVLQVAAVDRSFIHAVLTVWAPVTHLVRLHTLHSVITGYIRMIAIFLFIVTGLKCEKK